jgi:hypothetical protein
MDQYRVQASPTTPAKLPMLAQAVGLLKEGLFKKALYTCLLGVVYSGLLCIHELRQRDDLDLLCQRVALVAGIQNEQPIEFEVSQSDPHGRR